MRRRAGLAGIAATGAMLSATPVLACSCGVLPGPAPQLPASTQVFTGTVTQVDDPDGGGPVVSSARKVVVHLAVEKVYQGSMGVEQLVTTVASSSSCGFPFEVGQRYTVFVDPPAAGAIPTLGLCGGAVPGDIDPAAYGLGSRKSPPAMPSSTLRTALVSAGLVALLGAGVLMAVRVRRRYLTRG
jgi:hypothetical protein